MVKIKINEQEKYEINLPEEMDMGQLIGVVERLRLITKMSQNEFMPQVLETPNLIKAKREYKKRTDNSYLESMKVSKTLFSNRYLAVEFIKNYYLNDEEKMNTFLSSNSLGGWVNRHRTWYSKNCSRLRKHWAIEPSEVGIIKFPEYKGNPFVNIQHEPNSTA